MMLKIFVILAMMLPNICGAASTPIVPASHPTLWFNNASRLSAAQSYYASNPITPNAADYQALAYRHLMLGTSDESCTNVINWLKTYNPGGYDNMRGGGEIAITSFDWCYDKLGADKAAIITQINSWMDTYDGSTLGTPEQILDNYYWGVTRNVLMWGLTSYADQPVKAQTYLDSFNERWATNFEADYASIAGGVPTQGTEYGRYTLHYPLVPFISQDLEGANLYDDTNFFLEAMFWTIYHTAPSRTLLHGTANDYWTFFPFGDLQSWNTDYGEDYGPNTVGAFNNVGGAPGPFTPHWGEWWPEFMTTMAIRHSGTNAGRYAKQWLDMVTPTQLRPFMRSTDTSASISPLAFTNLALDFWGEGAKFLYAHSASTWADGTTLMFEGSNTDVANPDHVIAESGMIQLWRGGRWLTRGTASYGSSFQTWKGPTAAWQSTHSYSLNDRIYSGSSHYVQINSSTCTSGGSSPSFPGKSVSPVNDGTCAWVWAGGVGWAENAPREYYTTNLIHNGIVFNGMGELPPGQGTGESVTKRLESTAGYTYLAIDLTPRYQGGNMDYHPERNNPFTEHIERALVFVRSLETTVVLDRLQTKAHVNAPNITAALVPTTFALECEVDWTLNDATHETCTNNGQALHVINLVPASATRRVIDEGDCVGCDTTESQYRLELDASGTAVRYFLNVLQARGSSDNNITASVVDSNSGDPTSGTFTVTLHPSSGADTIIVFNKGVTVSGTETINIAETGVVSMATTPQTVTITDDGPQWGDAEADTTAPTITAFEMPATASSTTVNVTSFTATDAVGVTGYCITTVNSSAGCSWSGSAPTTATGAEGVNTFYAWARDAALNVSTASPDTTTITLPAASLIGSPSGSFTIH